jgi:hypothetical protein
MDTTNTPDDPSPAPAAPTAQKKPYEKPSFRFEKVFVTSALSCGKTSSSSLLCGIPKVS